jgi:PAS domain S-box-containing protein
MPAKETQMVATSTPPMGNAAKAGALTDLAVEILEQGEPVLAFDHNGRILFANRRFEALANTPREQMLGRRVHEVFPGAERLDERYRREHERTASPDQPISFEHYCPLTDRHFELLAYPMSTGVALYFRDITDRKEDERALHEAEQRFKLLVESVEDYAIFMLDRDGRIGSWNRGAERIKGYPREEIIGQPYERFFPPEARESGAPQAALESAAREGRYQTQDWRVRQDGSRFWADVTLTAIRDERGELIGFAKITRDLTERKRREDTLLRLESWVNSLDASLALLGEAGTDAAQPLRTAVSLNRAVLENALDAVVGMNAEGSVIDWNAQAETMFGYSRQEALGQPMCELIVPESHREGHRQGMKRYLASGEGRILNQRIEVPALRRSGEEFPVELTVTPLETQSGTLFYSFIRDISKQKAIEAERQALVARLERNLNLNETFFSVLGHDLRTPLAAILMNAQMLQRRSSEPGTKRMSEQIGSSAQRMARMIEQLLDLSRTRLGGGIPIEPKVMDLELVCQEGIIEILSANPQCGVEFSATGNCSGTWDPDRLAQVVSNLVDNAVHHCKADCSIQVALDGSAREAVELTVANQGAIPPDFLPLLFKPFERASQELGGRRGLGLGLYITHEIVRGHGGTIEVRSDETNGTCFIVRLPRSAAAIPVKSLPALKR